MEEFKIDIRSHFEQELVLKKNIFQVEETLETLGFTLFKAMNEKKRAKTKSEKQSLDQKIGNYRENMNDLKQKKDDLLLTYTTKLTKR